MSKNKYIIYHNPRCTKSRCALKVLQDEGKNVEVIDYLKTPPTFAELKDLLVKLNLSAQQIIRTKEDVYKKKFAGKKFEEDEWVKILTENPILIERPIVLKGNKAVIARSDDWAENML